MWLRRSHVCGTSSSFCVGSNGMDLCSHIICTSSVQARLYCGNTKTVDLCSYCLWSTLFIPTYSFLTFLSLLTALYRPSRSLSSLYMLVTELVTLVSYAALLPTSKEEKRFYKILPRTTIYLYFLRRSFILCIAASVLRNL